MYLIIIRHAESIKNTNVQFSSENDLEHLTPKGISDSLDVANILKVFLQKKLLLCKKIYSANSTRAINTSKIIAEELGLTLQVEESLRSTKPGSLAGKSEEEAKKTNPEFIDQLYLFRNGLFNAYDFTVAEGKEPKKDFEKRVADCLYNILSDESENIKIVVAHRSTITTILLGFAKAYYNYPVNFSGHVPLELGHISLLKKEVAGNWRILKVNCRSSELIFE